ncbi:MAG: class I SAM-dependent methyltransferase [Candidatus Syntrophonatronum acetioxidans]|uniref:Class I SAM-dependent methyltransferase n=1 Tax=Candidatus Syntrophonatronum acetioxidans TaxID=1795816 RepID=A0A424YIQ5_9FIRM|nr:MAG: class I SAM-dependent methyltransferase [Candidatus Syntrophonatronum acetioxidans]
MDLKSYGDLAWTERIIVSPEEYEEEVIHYIKAINKHAGRKFKTMLHLGCGAGGHDFIFKRYFQVTGVDISEDMLDIAQEVNPEVFYVRGDMREVRLNQKFDLVVIPDSISYMSTLKDLKKAIHTAAHHLCPDGILLVVTLTREEYQNNNFVYTGAEGDIHITIFENNHVISENQYEATLVYLIRQKKELQIHHEVHTLSLFSYDTWRELFSEVQLNILETLSMVDLYDRFVLEEREYRLKTYICTFRQT